MKPSRFTEEQIIGILREQEAGAATAEICRKHGISSAMFYKWKAKYGGLEVSDAKRLKALEDENAKLKKLLADAMLDTAMLKDVAAKNGDARRKAKGRLRSFAQQFRCERMAGVWGTWRGSKLGSLSCQRSGDEAVRKPARPISPEARHDIKGEWPCVQS